MTATLTPATGTEPELIATLEAIERRVLWLAVRIVDYANRERAEGRRAQGGRPPGVVGVDGDVDDGALPRRPSGRGPGLGEAARLAGAACDRVPARAARPLLPHAAAGLRRPAGVPVADEGSVSGRLLDRVGRARLGGAALRRARGPVHGDAASAPRPGAASSRCSATRSSTRGTSGRRSPTR